MLDYLTSPNCQISPDAFISSDARIHPSIRQSKLTIGAFTQIYDFAVIKFVGGNGDIEIGEHCYINTHCTLYSGNGIKLGNYVLIAPNTSLVPTNHSITRRDIEIRNQGFSNSRGGIVIEDDVWIGANCVILDGTIIRKGAVIGAGSIVKGEIEAYSINVGNPLIKIGERS